jgi:hypothetical protein
MQRFQGYCVTADGRVLHEDKRATPVLALHDGSKSLTAVIDKFWQNFPKALAADHNGVTLSLFPPQFGDVYELQGGEQKTHTVYLAFADQAPQITAWQWLHDRLIPRSTPEWYAKSDAWHYVTPLSQDQNTASVALIATAAKGPQSFFARREIIDEYGWRHFGDFYADHEAVGHRGKTPLVSHYNNQYDGLYGALVQYVRSGDRDWFELARDLAKHVIDIDIYHCQEDRAAYNGGLFWHSDHYVDIATATHRAFSKAALEANPGSRPGGGPSNEHNYTTGLLHYYFLTGDVMAREAVLSLADWVINMDDGSQRFLGYLDKRPTGFCSATRSRAYHGPGRGAGNSINALLDGYTLTQEKRYLAQAEALIRRCIHPHDDIQALHLEDVEGHWSYTVFLQALGKYLDMKIDQHEIDFMYSYARASLLHYAQWMDAHEVPYASIFERVEIPTETWPAQDIRKSIIFHFATKYTSDACWRLAYRQKADFFFQRSIEDVSAFPTCTLTRPLVLLMTNAYIHTYFQMYPDTQAPQAPQRDDFGHPRGFTAQFDELYRMRNRLMTIVSLLHKMRQYISAGWRQKQRYTDQPL